MGLLADRRAIGLARAMSRLSGSGFGLLYLRHHVDTGRHEPIESVAEALAASLGAEPSVAVVRALNAALTRCVPTNEINPGTFVARIAASSEGAVHSCIAAAISANSGTRIARGCDRLEHYFRDSNAVRTLVKALADSAPASDVAAAGFSHRSIRQAIRAAVACFKSCVS
jgi:citrate synthase